MIGQLHCNDSAVKTTEVKQVFNKNKNCEEVKIINKNVSPENNIALQNLASTVDS